LTRHTVIEVIGSEHVEAAVVVHVDENWEPIPGTERRYTVDTVCLAVGLRPTVDLLDQMGCEMKNVLELGGEVPVRNRWMETSVPGIYVAGDASGIEEASSAMLEGRLAGLDAAEKVAGHAKVIARLKEETLEELTELRAGPFGEKNRVGDKKLRQETHSA
jgi:sarcosine oxidase subunit alpha